MRRRKWKPEQKALIVLKGLKGWPIGELCAEHQISQAQYYQWRDLFLANTAEEAVTHSSSCGISAWRLTRSSASRRRVATKESACETSYFGAARSGNPGTRSRYLTGFWVALPGGTGSSIAMSLPAAQIWKTRAAADGLKAILDGCQPKGLRLAEMPGRRSVDARSASACWRSARVQRPEFSVVQEPRCVCETVTVPKDPSSAEPHPAA
jgi:transposase-like protein